MWTLDDDTDFLLPCRTVRSRDIPTSEELVVRYTPPGPRLPPSLSVTAKPLKQNSAPATPAPPPKAVPIPAPASAPTPVPAAKTITLPVVNLKPATFDDWAELRNTVLTETFKLLKIDKTVMLAVIDRFPKGISLEEHYKLLVMTIRSIADKSVDKKDVEAILKWFMNAMAVPMP